MGRDMPENAEIPAAWDDAKFIARIEELAVARGLALHEVALAANLARDYFVKRGGGRGRNIVSIVRLAGVLGVPVSELVDPPANPPAPIPSDPSAVDPVKLKRLATVAIAAANLYLVLDGKSDVPEDTEAEELLQALMRFVEPPRRRPRRS